MVQCDTSEITDKSRSMLFCNLGTEDETYLNLNEFPLMNDYIRTGGGGALSSK